MSDHYVMLGNHRIDCPEEYMKELGLVDGQAIDHATVDDLNKLTDAAFDLHLKSIRNSVDRLREAHDELLAAAKDAYPLVVLKDCTPGRQIVTRLQAAIARAEEPAP